MPIFGWEGLKNLGKKQQTPAPEIGTGPATKCSKCNEILIKKTLEDNLWVCPMCDHHHRVRAWDRVNITLDEGTFIERDADMASMDILEFRASKSYDEKLEETVSKTGMLSAMVSGTGKLHGRDVALGITDMAFIAGSMGSVVGEKYTRIAETALEKQIPFISISGSGGGARMYEGLYSLMQMAKTSAALGRLREAGIPFISIVTDLTMAGVWASWAALGDVIIAEPKATIGFTGRRVIEATINCDLPEGFQYSEFLLEHGQVDMIVKRIDMKDKLGSLLDKICGPLPEIAEMV